MENDYYIFNNTFTNYSCKCGHIVVCRYACWRESSRGIMTGKRDVHSPEDWDKRQEKEAISMLNALIKKIRYGKFKVRSKGWWHSNVGGRMSFHVDVTNLDMEEDENNS